MFKKIISTVLSICMVLTCLSVGIVSVSATEGLTVQGTSNYFDSFTKVVDPEQNKVTVAFAIKSSKNLLNAEWYLTYDNTKLQFIDDDNMDYEGNWTIMPYVPNAIINTDVGGTHNKLCGNVSSVNTISTFSSTDKPKSFVSVTFDVIGTGTAVVDLQLRNLTVGAKDPSTGLLDPDSEESVVSLYQENVNSTAVTSSSAVVYDGYYDESNIPDDSPEDSGLTFNSYTLALASNIEMIFNVNESKLDGYSNPYVVVTVNGEDTVITDYTTAGSNLRFRYTKIYPQLIGDDITAVLYATKNGSEKHGPEYTRSVKGYCTNMLNNLDHTTYSKFHTLLVNLLNYGAQAQTYIGYKTNSLCNKDLTAEQSNWALTDLGTLNNVRNMNAETISNPTVTFNAASLSLGSTVGITMYFTTDNIDNKTIVATVSGNEYSFTSEDFEPVAGYNNRYKFTFSELYANDMRKTVSFKAYENNNQLVSNTATYSIESYVASHTNDGTAVADLINAMYLYGQSAIAYAA